MHFTMSSKHLYGVALPLLFAVGCSAVVGDDADPNVATAEEALVRAATGTAVVTPPSETTVTFTPLDLRDITRVDPEDREDDTVARIELGTGRTSVLAPSRGPTDSDESYPGVDLAIPGVSFAFSSPETATDPKSYPARATPQIFSQWKQAGSVGSCSATFIDSRHLLTAAHCIYKDDVGGFADEVMVFTGDGNFGTGRVIDSFEGYTKYGRYSYDVAIVMLDEPIGALTGWLGYGSRSCAHLTNKNTDLFRYSHPAEGPHANDFIFQKGRYDWCPASKLVQYNQTGWRGQSGSSAFETSNGGYAVRTIASHKYGLLPKGTRSVRLWDGAVSHFSGIINGRRAKTPDLIPLKLTTGANEVTPKADGRIPNVRFVVHNYSNAAFNGNVRATVRLSSNPTISASDPVIGTFDANTPIEAMGARWIVFPNGSVVVPKTVTPGLYYVGVRIENNDANTSNNTITGALATRALIVNDADADLAVKSVTPTVGTYGTHQTVPLTFVVENIGELGAAAFTGDFLLSKFSIADASAIKVAAGNGPALAPGQKYQRTVNLPLTGVPDGNYFVHVRVKSPNDPRSGNDFRSSVTKISVQKTPTIKGPPADLAIDYVGLVAGEYAKSDKVRVAFQVTNRGTNSGSWTAQFSAARNVGDSALLLAEGGSGALASGASYATTVDVPLSALSTGTWFLQMIIDTPDDVNEANNAKWAPMPIVIKPSSFVLGGIAN
jgi:V8-like Glu-specific endopeptidase